MKDHKNKTQSNRSSLKLLWIFCLLVVLAVVFSLGYRLFTLMRESKFDGQHQFIVAFINNADVDVVSVNPSQKAYNHLQIRGGKNSSDDLQQAGVIPDSYITLPKPFSLDSLSEYFSEAAWHQGNVTSPLNLYDLYRLSLLTKHIDRQAITSESVHIPFDQTASSTMLEQLFIDDAIDQDNKTVAIINGAGLPGLGTRLEQALSLRGVNVISVTNADGVKSSSKITYVGDKTYTVKRLSQLLSLPTEEVMTQGISDIIITLGKDKTTTTQF